MNPEQLSAKDTEHGHQVALFAWSAMACYQGFVYADSMAAYSSKDRGIGIWPPVKPVPELAWLHSIPNGGLRDPRTAAMMKAEGLRSGVADVFLPVPRRDSNGAVTYCGLYIEMKKPGRSVQSPEQKAFEAHCNAYGYLYRLCKSWREAADAIKEYLL